MGKSFICIVFCLGTVLFNLADVEAKAQTSLRVSNTNKRFQYERSSRFPSCGHGVQVCGVLTLESGLGEGVYHHPSLPTVHGIWPEVGKYGDSKCLTPKESSKEPAKLFPCYDIDADLKQDYSFEMHEWEKHGMCAGIKNAEDFFKQVCDLSRKPLEIMSKYSEFPSMTEALLDAGYSVFRTDGETAQIMLSACLNSDIDKWILSEPTKFSQVCGSKIFPPTPSSEEVKCLPNEHGPKCRSDSDCEGVAGCIRCAHSGFCTTQPLLSQSKEEVEPFSMLD